MKRKRRRSLLLTVLLSLVLTHAASAQANLSVLVKAISKSDQPAVQAALLKGMLNGLEGQRGVKPPMGWKELSDMLRKSDNAAVRKLVDQLSQVFGDKEAVKRALTTLMDPKKSLPERRTALQSLLTQQIREVIPLLHKLLDDEELRVDAIRAYGAMEVEGAPKMLLARAKSWKTEYRKCVIETLATRRTYAPVIVEALKDESIAKKEIPPYVARSLSILLGKPFVDVYGDVRDVSQGKKQLIAKYKKLVTESDTKKASASRGRKVYKKTCGACHRLFDDGGDVGPNLTGSNRRNLDYLLLNLLDPSYDVPAGYRMVSIATANGRIISGIVAEEDTKKLVLKTAEQPRVVIAKDDIDDRKLSPLSLMPEGQLLKMSKQEVLDLIHYLRSDKQVEVHP